MVDFPPSSADPASAEDRDPRVVGVDSEDADDLVSALTSETGRDLLAELYDEPGTPAALADRVGTSLQNVQYHLGKLEDGDLAAVVDTVYSEKGREMSVYGPTAQPLVLFAGNEEETVGLQSALKNLLGGVGVLGLASLVVQRLSTGRHFPFFSTGGSGGFGGNDNAAEGTTGESGRTAGRAERVAAETEPPEATGRRLRPTPVPARRSTGERTPREASNQRPEPGGTRPAPPPRTSPTPSRRARRP